MAGDNDHEDESAAARAFADLHAEVAVMRKAVESLPALIEEFSAPDYAPSFGAIAKALTNVEARLAGIEGHPALTMTPEAHGRATVRIVADATEEATRALRDETGSSNDGNPQHRTQHEVSPAVVDRTPFNESPPPSTRHSLETL